MNSSQPEVRGFAASREASQAPFFANPHRVQALYWAAADWLGTPFAWGQCVRDAGVDCVRLAWELYQTAGLYGVGRQSPDFPEYQAGEDAHSQTSKVDRWLAESPCFLPIQLAPVRDPEPGDLLTFTISRHPFHVGVMLESPRFVHVLVGQKVIESDLRDGTWARRLTGIWRPVES